MVDRTQNLRLEHLSSPGDILTEGIESRRFGIIDTQLSAIFRALGSGRVSTEGTWELTDYSGRTLPTPRNDTLYFKQDVINASNNSRFIYLSPGYGHVNNMAVETTKHVKIGPLPYRVNYVYMYTTENTPRTKTPGITVFPTRQDDNNQQYLNIGEVTFDTANSITNINQDTLLEVSSLTFLLADLINHTHGKDGVSKIDLETEVRGLLSADNISDIDPSRINTGTLNPDIIQISHTLLKDSGILTHTELDSAVTLLQRSNKKLFGDLTAANLLQSFLAVKRVYSELDQYFRNFIAIIPGLDNITEDNENSFLDSTSYVSSSNQEDDEANKADAIADPGRDTREDAAIVDFANSEIRGIQSSGNTVGDYSIDTEVEFKTGNYNSNFISITSESQYIYGYGFGYGEGIDFFDVFGVAAGTFESGYAFHYGYGLPEFESSFGFGESGFGYGYQLTDGGAFDPGSVNVTLVPGQSDIDLYDYSLVTGNSNDLAEYDDQHENFFSSTDGEVGTDPALDTVDNFFMSGKVVFVGGTGAGASYFDTILRYEVDPNSEKWDGDISSYKSINLNFNRPNFSYIDADGDTQTTYALHNSWRLRLTFVDDLGAEYEFDTEIRGMESGEEIVGETAFASLSDIPSEYEEYTVKYIDIIPHVLGQNSNLLGLSHDFDLPWNYYDNPPVQVPAIPTATENNQGGVYQNQTVSGNVLNRPLIWNLALSSIGLSGVVNYSGTDSQNSIDNLYIVIPADQTVTWDTISWIADEPGDSRVVIQLRTIDGNSVAGDPFDALEEIEWGHPYSNKSGIVFGGADEPARPSGSTITEGAENDDGISQGTHLEIRVTLQAGESDDIAPTLHAITIRYSSQTGSSERVFEDAEGWIPNLQTTSDRINITLTATETESIEIRNKSDVTKLLVGRTNTFAKFNRFGDRGFSLQSSADQTLAAAPPSAYQIIQGTTSSGNVNSGALFATKRMINQDIVVADATNHRILFYDATSLNFKKGIYGAIGLYGRNYYTSSTAIDKEFSILQAIFNPTEKTIYIVFSHMIDASAFKVDAVQVTGTNDVTYVISTAKTTSSIVSYDFIEGALGDVDGEGHVVIPAGNFDTIEDGTETHPVPAASGNVVRIKLTDSEVNIINNIDTPREINVRTKTTDVSGNVVQWFVRPYGFQVTNGEDVSSIGGALHDSTNPGESHVPNRLYADLEEYEIYYRPLINPIDIEVMHDNKFAVCCVTPFAFDPNSINQVTANNPQNEIDFPYWFRTVEENGKLAPLHGDVVSFWSTSTGKIHYPIQFYDLDNEDLYDRFSDGTVKVSDGNVDKTSDGTSIFSTSLGGSIKEIVIDEVYYYIIADSGNRRVKIVTTDFSEIVWEVDIDEDLGSGVLGDASYYPSCADKGGSYYYVSLIGIGGSNFLDNKVIELKHNKTLNRSPILNRQLGNPMDVDYNADTNSIIIST